MLVGIIDYGVGNLLSVQNAFEAVGAQTKIVDRGADLHDCGPIVLPGVGAFAKGMSGLRERGFVEALEREVREKKKPFLGICVGMQLLAHVGHELGEHEGLGWIRGSVDRFDEAHGLAIPHVGWNDVWGEGALFAALPRSTSFYFLHSFHMRVESGATVSGTCEYGEKFTAAIEHEHIHAVQFHPEKSHKSGLAVLKNFCAFAKAA